VQSFYETIVFTFELVWQAWKIRRLSFTTSRATLFNDAGLRIFGELNIWVEAEDESAF
jgi:hypothetical protein